MMTRRLMTDLQHAFVRGTGASVVSALALAACSKRETGSALAGINAASHWAWGDDDARRNGFSWKHTALGALTLRQPRCSGPGASSGCLRHATGR